MLRRRCVLVVDEVQNLTFAALEELRMLSNITVDGQASVQTILLGQPQFRPILASCRTPIIARASWHHFTSARFRRRRRGFTSSIG